MRPCNGETPILSARVAGFCSSRARPLFPLAYKFTEGAGSVEALASLPGAHLEIQAFGETSAATVAAVPATPPPGHKEKGDPEGPPNSLQR